MKYLYIIIFSSFCNYFISGQTGFNEELSMMDFSINVENSQIHDLSFYKITSDSISKTNSPNISELVELFKEKDFFDTKSYLKVHTEFSCVWAWDTLTYISYQEIQDTIISPMNIYKIGNDSELDLIIEKVLQLPAESFWEFYSNEQNPDYPLINQHKIYARSPRNNLDLFKLYDLLKKHPELLE